MTETLSSLLVDVVRQATDPHDHAHGPGEQHDHGHGATTNVTNPQQAAGGTSAYCTSRACMRNWKIAFAVILFLEGVVFGYFALIMKRMISLETKRFRTLLSFVNTGGGGIFLATGMLHILPEALALLEPKEAHADAHGGHNHGHSFPVGPAVILATFVAFIFLEKVLFPHTHGGPEQPEAGDPENHHDWTEAASEENDDMVRKRNGFGSKQFIAMTLTTLGIALHSILESVALGSASQWGTVLNTFIAIATHRWATTMALGAKYERESLTPLCYSILVVGFALVAPIGVAIGVGVRTASDMVIGIVFALSAGIFLYIGAFEIPAEEFVARREPRKKLQFAKFGVYALGCGIIAAITGILVATGTGAH